MEVTIRFKTIQNKFNLYGFKEVQRYTCRRLGLSAELVEESVHIQSTQQRRFRRRTQPV